MHVHCIRHMYTVQRVPRTPAEARPYDVGTLAMWHLYMKLSVERAP